MSTTPANEPACTGGDGDAIELVIEARPRDLGELTVRRTLPSMQRRHVGPFVFFDHMGPVEFPPGAGIAVRPHPHVALATVTYLFDGEIIHRDSLGSHQPIRPGEVNWMVAGRGIVHSERSAPEVKAKGSRLHGIQSWVALPLEDEETDPRFEHHPLATIPMVERPGVALRVIAGNAYGAKAPTGVRSPTLYAHAAMQPGATLDVDQEHEERAAYVVDGEVACDGRAFHAGTMVVFRPGCAARLTSKGAAHVMLLGGAEIGPRFIEWNFVASTKERIERAKNDWRAGRFPKVPGDEVEFIPLP